MRERGRERDLEEVEDGGGVVHHSGVCVCGWVWVWVCREREKREGGRNLEEVEDGGGVVHHSGGLEPVAAPAGKVLRLEQLLRVQGLGFRV